MRKLRVLVLTHESLVPPDSLEGHPQQKIDEWQTEYDVMSCLRQAFIFHQTGLPTLMYLPGLRN